MPEHLRLGTWDLLCGWSEHGGETVYPRLAMQIVHESALCVCNLRKRRTLSQKGFELANGLPFVGADPAIHDLLEAHSFQDCMGLQAALGRIRRASGHFPGQVVAIDPHRITSSTKRQTPRHTTDKDVKPTKVIQTFFSLDTDTKQPICFTVGTAAKTVTQATPELLALSADILQPSSTHPLLLADNEHYTVSLIEHFLADTPFEFMIPAPNQSSFAKIYRSIPDNQFTPRWAGIATATVPYRLKDSKATPLYLIVQRSGELPDEYLYKGFITNSKRIESDLMSIEFPKRWDLEEFFKMNQDLGWNRGGTLNLHIRYAQMSMALLAQAAIHQFRQRLGAPFSSWDARHLAQSFFAGLDGDVRLRDDTILVTFYNAPHSGPLRHHLEHLPDILSNENVDPRVPWLYNFKLDFRFK